MSAAFSAKFPCEHRSTALWWWWKAQPSTSVHGDPPWPSASFSAFSASAPTWLFFSLAVYGLPFFVGMTIAFAAPQGGSGILTHGAHWPPGGLVRLGSIGSLAVLLAAARQDQGVALAVRIIEQVGKDGRHEGRIVGLERALGPALVRLLRPGRPDLSATLEDSWRDSIADANGAQAVLFLRYGLPLFA